MRAAVFALPVMLLLAGVAWAASPGDLRARLQSVQEDLRTIESAQMMYGGRFPPQLITDISRHVALPARLEEWRGAMKAAEARLDAGQLPQAEALLQSLASATGPARVRADDIVRYWLQRPAHDRRDAQWERFTRINRVAPPQAADIAAARQRLEDAMVRHDFALASRTLLPELKALLEAGFVEGRKLAFDVERDDRLVRERELPCPVPVQSGVASPGPKPRIDAERFESPEDFYPPTARRDEREGRVNVEVDVDAMGCGRRARVIVASGDADLDEAALALALRGSAYFPARGPEGPIDGTVRFWISFEFPAR
jgi:TonB family protein